MLNVLRHGLFFISRTSFSTMALCSLFHSWGSYLKLVTQRKKQLHHLTSNETPAIPAVSVVSTGTQYPSNRMGPEALAEIAFRHYADGPA
jgi:hypothetical protein